MIPDNCKTEILRRIKAAEQEHDIRIVYAVESGSRVWGFDSPDSDFDVRFIYVRPTTWYLSVDLESRRDVIEYPIEDEIDINGWDIRKALQLFTSSNPTLIEWLHSPMRYRDDGVFAATLRRYLSDFYAPDKGIHHYRSMAKTNYRGYLKAEVVPVKKYFYVLRPLLSVMWLERYQQVPPVEFQQLRQLIVQQTDLNRQVDALLVKKRVGAEQALLPAIPEINAFIEQQLARLETLQPHKTASSGDIQLLNQLFHHYCAVI